MMVEIVVAEIVVMMVEIVVEEIEEVGVVQMENRVVGREN